MNSIFISYVDEESQFAKAISAGLESAGYKTWYYERDGRQMGSYIQQFMEAMDEARAVVVIVSLASVKSNAVHIELMHAHQMAKPIIPIFVDMTRPELRKAQPVWEIISSPAIEISATLDTILQVTMNLKKCLKAIGIDPGGAMDKPLAHTESTSSPDIPFKVPVHRDDSRTEIYDVFISYRRDKASQTARLIRAELQNLGYRVFLDVDDLRQGHFDEALLQRIRETPNFVLILFAGSLDRCADPEDWLRREIVCAIEAKQKIVPILMPGFTFPASEALPSELRPIRIHNAIPYSHDFFKAMLEKLAGFLGPRRSG